MEVSGKLHENKLVDIFTSIFLIVVSILMYVSTLSFKQMTTSRIGSDFLPQITAIALFGLSLILLINALVKWKREKKAVEEVASTGTKEEKVKINYTLVIISLVLMGVYLVTMTKIGFLITTSVYLFIQIYLISPTDKRSPIRFAIVSIVMSTFIYYIFKNVFYLMLPSGILG